MRSIQGFNWSDLPELMGETDVMRITGWARTTLLSKKSRGEIPYNKILNVYPRDEFRRLIDDNFFLPEAIRTENFAQKVAEARRARYKM